MHHSASTTGTPAIPCADSHTSGGDGTYQRMDARAEQRSDIERRFTHHPPKRDQVDRYAQLRAKAKELALLIADVTPYSREQSTAITLLEQSLMMANAAIARNE